MSASQVEHATSLRDDWDHAFTGVLVDFDARRRADAAGSGASVLRCVSTGYLADGCSCPASVPVDVATEAWSTELRRGHGRTDRFFRFAWRDEVWLAFGIRDGSVRGVYCPEHGAERDERAALADSPPRRLAHGA
jgi:hypothetical protein